jgi:hypothetical protein
MTSAKIIDSEVLLRKGLERRRLEVVYVPTYPGTSTTFYVCYLSASINAHT